MLNGIISTSLPGCYRFPAKAGVRGCLHDGLYLMILSKLTNGGLDLKCESKRSKNCIQATYGKEPNDKEQVFTNCDGWRQNAGDHLLQEKS